MAILSSSNIYTTLYISSLIQLTGMKCLDHIKGVEVSEVKNHNSEVGLRVVKESC